MAKTNKSSITEYNVDVFTFSRALMFQQEGIILNLSDKTKGRFMLSETNMLNTGLQTLQTVYSAIASVKQNEALFSAENITYAAFLAQPIPSTLVCELDEEKSIVKVYFSQHPTLPAYISVRRIG